MRQHKLLKIIDNRRVYVPRYRVYIKNRKEIGAK